jgi:hypothetical protein
MIVGNGSTDPVAESGATLRTSIGVGTGDSPQFTAVNVGAASDTTLARASAGNLTVEGNALYRAGGTDVAIADGGTGAGTAAAGFAALSPLTTRGDVLYGSSGTVTGARLAVGSANEVLTSDGTDVAWAAAGGGQTACVRVYTTADQTIGTTTEVALPFAGETFDVGGFHDNTTNNSRLTVPSGEAGKYWVAARVHWTPTSVGKVECNLKINGGVAAHFANENSNDASPGFNYDIYDLADGDYVECIVYQNSGGNMTVQFHSSASSGLNAGTTLMMHRLS